MRRDLKLNLSRAGSHGYHLKPRGRHTKLIGFEDGRNVEIEVTLIVRNLLNDHPDIVKRGDHRSGDRAPRRVDHSPLKFRGAQHAGNGYG